MDRSELAARVASHYYERGLTQAEIAKRIHTSRSTVSRLLREARETGIVEFIIRFPHQRLPQLEQDLCQRFDLREVRVVAGRDRSYAETLSSVGRQAASYLADLIEPGTILAISWGTSVHATVTALHTDEILPITVIQMIGAAGTENPLIDGPDLARTLASVYGGRALSLPAPLIVRNEDVRDSLLQDPIIAEALSLARKANVALVGIGTVVEEFSSWLRAGYLEADALDELQALGAVGDICGWHYDAYGQLLDIDLNRRIVGLQLADLQAIGQVVAVAAGKAKAAAVLGALRGKHVDVLVTDEEVAQSLVVAGEVTSATENGLV